jgi:hypothetical protein
MIDPWIWASGAIIVGLLSGVVGAALIRQIILKGREDRPEMADAARATATFLFLFFAAVGVIVAIGFTNPETLEPIPADVLRTSPRVLAAGLILIAGRAMAFAVGGLVNSGLEGSSGRVRSQVTSTARLLIYAAAFVLALSQLGVDTTILSIITAAVTFGVAGAFALLVGLGGKELSGELAAGRYLHRIVRVGDRVEFATGSGRVTAMHPATIELDPGDGSCVHVPHSALLRSELKVLHP